MCIRDSISEVTSDELRATSEEAEVTSDELLGTSEEEQAVSDEELTGDEEQALSLIHISEPTRPY